MCLQVDLGTRGFAFTGLELIDHSWNLFVFIFQPTCLLNFHPWNLFLLGQANTNTGLWTVVTQLRSFPNN